MITCHKVFNVWSKTTLLSVWPGDAKRLDPPARLVLIHAESPRPCWLFNCGGPGANLPCTRPPEAWAGGGRGCVEGGMEAGRASGVFILALLCSATPPCAFPAVVSASCLRVEFLSPVWPQVLKGMTQVLVCCLRMFLLPAIVGDRTPMAGTRSGSIPVPFSHSAAQSP